MVVISVLYPNSEAAHFDMAYYLATHIPLVKARWSGLGLGEVRVLRGQNAPDGAAATYQAIALLGFASMADFAAAGAAHGAEIFADIPKFTNVSPVLQFNEPLL